MAEQNPVPGIKVEIINPRPRAEPKPEYIYHWNRIFGAIAVLILLIGLIGYGLYTWLKPSSPLASAEVEEVAGHSRQTAREAVEVDLPRLPKAEEPPAEIAEPAPSQTPITDSPPVYELDARTSGRLAAAQTPLGEKTTEPAPSQTPIANSSSVHEQLDAKTIGGPATVQAPLGEETSGPASMPIPVHGEIAETTPAQAPVFRSDEKEPWSKGQERTSEAVATDYAPEEQTGNGLFRSQNISISSPAVKRFVLARSVAGNEPKGGLGDIEMNADGVAAVCSFSEVIGLAGEILEYRWFHDGKQVLQIRVPVGAERWRSHAQKAIYKRMKGAWRVELRDSAGQLLASADFVF